MIFNRKNKKLAGYLALLDEIGQKQFLMPIEEIRLGNQFAELKDPKVLKKNLLTKKYLNHENFHVRRVLAIAFRRLDTFNDIDINQAMKAFLNDKEHWVVYDAIWYFQEAKTTDQEIINSIKQISENTELTDKQKAETSPSSDATLNMKWMADETLEILK